MMSKPNLLLTGKIEILFPKIAPEASAEVNFGSTLKAEDI